RAGECGQGLFGAVLAARHQELAAGKQCVFGIATLQDEQSPVVHSRLAKQFPGFHATLDLMKKAWLPFLLSILLVPAAGSVASAQTADEVIGKGLHAPRGREAL